MNSVILIPALNPDEKLIQYVKALAEYGFEHIIVVNDGSSAEYKKIFDSVKTLEQCTLLTHEVNCGKGRALKTGMEYYLKNIKGFDGIITGDADGQHTLENTAEIDKKMQGLHRSLILGCRNFSGSDVPKRSQFGNRTTSRIFKLLYGKRISDTQTGLRGIPNDVIQGFTDLKGERFEYEMNMLIACVDNGIEIIEVPIETIYLEKNSSSHFKVIRDSVKIYRVLLQRFLKYVASGVSAFVIDQTFYRLMIFVILPLFITADATVTIGIATFVARLISSVYNFIINKLFVFNKKKNTASSFLKFFVMAAGVMLLSALCVTAVTKIFSLSDIASANVKIVIDTVLSLVSFIAQRNWVFKKK